jgi:hypothetical protein
LASIGENKTSANLFNIKYLPLILLSIMFHNVGKIDRIVRVVLGITLVVLYFTKVVQGGWATAAIVAAVVLLMTGLRKCCPFYAMFGFGTCSVQSDKTDRPIKSEKLNLK